MKIDLPNCLLSGLRMDVSSDNGGCKSLNAKGSARCWSSPERYVHESEAWLNCPCLDGVSDCLIALVMWISDPILVGIGHAGACYFVSTVAWRCLSAALVAWTTRRRKAAWHLTCMVSQG